jgi:cytochrome P450 family 110
VVAFADLPSPRTPALFNALEYGFSPRRFARRHTARLGRAFLVPLRPESALFTSEPEHVRRIFGADSDAFKTLAAISLQGLLGARSVLLTSGAEHRRQRKLLAPPLNGARLRAFGATMQTIADQHVARLTPGQSFRAHDLTTAFTLDVIARTVFGVSAPDGDPELRALLTALVHEIPRFAIFAPFARGSWYPPWTRYLRQQQHFERWLNDKLAERRREAARGEDVLSLLLEARYDDGSAMDDREIRDQLVTLLLAGHETTAIALATCLSRLHRHPDVLARVQQELAAHAPTPESVVRLPYLSAAIDETLRIDPIVTDVSRIARAEFALDDELVLKPQQVVIVLIEALHRDPQLYPEPERFRPERFLERKYLPHEFLPFGGGVRRCLGAAFSDYETKIMLATLLRRVELRLRDARPEPRVRRNITMGPKRGVPMRVERLR